MKKLHLLSGIFLHGECRGLAIDTPFLLREFLLLLSLSQGFLFSSLYRMPQGLEKIFPFLGVRFIAVNDGIDTADPASVDSLALHLKNLVNDVYARDISAKISSVLVLFGKSFRFPLLFPSPAEVLFYVPCWFLPSYCPLSRVPALIATAP